jgi:hypothetical protein
LLLGDYQAFTVDGEQFSTTPLDLPEPLLIMHSDLVILDSEREECEARNALARPKYANTAEQRATALMLCTLAIKAYGADALEHPYRTAARLCEQMQLTGETLSIEGVAKKLKAAAAVMPGGSEFARN